MYNVFTSGIARSGPTRACALPPTSPAGSIPSPVQKESHDSTMNLTKSLKEANT